MPGVIFVSYRRATTSNAAGRLADRLMDRFGEEQVFVDVDVIEPGVDWVDVIEKAVAACRVLLVVIGPEWHAVTDADGRRRLDDPNDAVAIEVRAGLANPAIRVIPVLVDGARMPRAEDLPADLRRLARINAAQVEHATFRRDAMYLMDVLERVIATPRVATSVPVEELIDDLRPPTTSSDIEEARRLIDAGGAADLIVATYRRAIDFRHPDAGLAWAEIGWVQWEVADRSAGDRTEAVESFRRAVASGHRSAESLARMGMGLAAVLNGDWDEGEDELSRVANSRYRLIAMQANHLLVGLLANRRDFAGARDAYRRSIELGGERMEPSWVVNVASALQVDGDAEAATALLYWALDQPDLDEPSAQAVRAQLAKRLSS